MPTLVAGCGSPDSHAPTAERVSTDAESDPWTLTAERMWSIAAALETTVKTRMRHHESPDAIVKAMHRAYPAATFEVHESKQKLSGTIALPPSYGYALELEMAVSIDVALVADVTVAYSRYAFHVRIPNEHSVGAFLAQWPSDHPIAIALSHARSQRQFLNDSILRRLTMTTAVDDNADFIGRGPYVGFALSYQVEEPSRRYVGGSVFMDVQAIPEGIGTRGGIRPRLEVGQPF
ncbi:MAG: hypothetical protein KDC95_11145 [Planctomycetes bacterium]|nr:hypothetical protein [Planctomycetota bacterium]